MTMGFGFLMTSLGDCEMFVSVVSRRSPREIIVTASRPSHHQVSSEILSVSFYFPSRAAS